MSRSVTLTGKITKVVVAPAGETTGFRLKIANLEVDVDEVSDAAAFLGKPCFIGGELRASGCAAGTRLQTLVAREMGHYAAAFLGAALCSGIYLPGYLSPAQRAGGQGSSHYELVEIEPEIDLRAVDRYGLVGKDVVATGTFELVRYPTMGFQFVFRASEVRARRSSQLV